VDVLLVVEEEVQRHHHQEGAAKGRDRQMRVMHDPGIFPGLRGGQHDGLPGADLGGDHHDQHREQDAHPEHGDQDAPGQEALLPDRRHFLELVGVDDGVVEGQRDFQHRQNADDEEHLQRAADGMLGGKAQPEAEPEPDDRDDEGPFEIAEGGAVGDGLRAHARAPVARVPALRGSRKKVSIMKQGSVGFASQVAPTSRERRKLSPEGPGHRYTPLPLQAACAAHNANLSRVNCAQRRPRRWRGPATILQRPLRENGVDAPRPRQPGIAS